MSVIRQKHLMYAVDQDEPPAKKLTSDGDILIKQLAEKQRNTTTTLEEQLATTKEFTKATELTPLSNYSPGTSTLKRFEETTQRFHTIETLKSIGLTTDDIELYFDSLKEDDYLFRKHKNWEKNLLTERVKEIEEIIKSYEQTQNTLGKDIKKQLQKHDVVEHGLSVKPNSTETKLLKFALDNQNKKNKSVLPHPIDNIKEIEHDRFSYLNHTTLPEISKIRRKARKLLNRINKLSDSKPNNQTKTSYKKLQSESWVKNSKWDVTTPEKEEHERIVEKKVYTCKPQNYYTIQNGKIVKLNKSECEVRQLETIPKLTVEEIKKLPKFENYEPGNQSKVLYIKNLSTNVKVEELQALFKEFDKNKNVSYKIMTGKMRGQAFVSFPDENIASQALEEVNGTYIRNKPVIIQFGRGNT